MAWRRSILVLLWLVVLGSLVPWSHHLRLPVGWDLNVYKAALIALRQGHDPYADAIVVQQSFFAVPHPPGTVPPFCYVYAPLTLPLLKLVGLLPLTVAGIVFWGLYGLGTLTAIWFGATFAHGERERTMVKLLAPAAIALPGLMNHDVIFCGNVAYILYGLVAFAMYYGLKRHRWLPFYGVVLLASCIKAPLLSLVVIPVLCARRQWIPMFVTGASSVVLFLLQGRLWPGVYQHYLAAVQLQFQLLHEFGMAPAGLLSDALYGRVPYQVTWGAFWLLCACLFAAVLFRLRRRFLHGHLTAKEWVPVMWCGVVLLNPRIMEYDVAAITLMMGLVAFRLLAAERSGVMSMIRFVGFIAILNVLGHMSSSWRPVECVTLVSLFFAGAWQLDRRGAERRRMASVEEIEVMAVRTTLAKLA